MADIADPVPTPLRAALVRVSQQADRLAERAHLAA
jgi:hypothetical protein